MNLALANTEFLKTKMTDANGHLYRSYKNNQAKIGGFLEDYAFVIEAYTALFESVGEKSWLDEAARLTEIAITEFFDDEKGLFSFTSTDQKNLIIKTFEMHDNVIPASNSVMARNLFQLSYLLDRPDYRKIAENMIALIVGNMADYPSGYSNWSQLLLDLTESHLEVAIVGSNAFSLLNKLQKNYLPQVVFCSGTSENDLPLLANRFVAGKTLIYICQDNSCQLPVETVKEALRLIQGNGPIPNPSPKGKGVRL